MLTRITAVALAAGILAGLCVALLQSVTTTPLILAAEAFETAPAAEAHAHGQGTEAAAGPAHDHGGAEWAPADGLPRTLYTSLGTIGTTFGFALVLLSAMLLAGARITPRSGLVWGCAAFVCTGLAPALGLAPELPGSAAAELAARQYWWAGTALATAAGLWLALRSPHPAAIVAGVALIALPHLIGAPHPEAYASAVPSEISGHFAAASLVVHAVTWALTGLALGAVWQRSGSAEAAPAAA